MTSMNPQLRQAAVCLLATAALTANAQIRIPNGSPGKAVALTADMTVVTTSRTATGSFQQTESGKFWRSSDGKTRQDNAAGSLINDRAAGMTISLNHQERSATVIQRTPRSQLASGGGVPGAPTVLPPPGTIETKSGQTIERLEAREFSGIEATGMRVTIQNAGGRLGPVTTETWIAPALGLAILFKETRIDGATEQRYENVQFGEPPADVFQIPSGYTVRTAAMRKAEAPPNAMKK